jgi:predicted TIM-barrel fold metal-dependent hydrolase
MPTTDVVDCDTHYWEPLELWADYLDPAFRNQAPHFVHDGDRLLMQVGESIYPSAPEHPGLAKTYGPDETLHEQTIWDKAVSTDAPRRLKTMDEEGVDVQIIFPTLGMVGFSGIRDPQLAGACARAYNRYCADFAATDPRRLRPTMLLPFNHPDVAIEEMRYAREQCGLTITFVNPTPPLETCWSDPVFDNLWSAMEDLNVTLALHESAVGAGPSTVGVTRYRGRSRLLYLCAHTVEPQLAIMDLILGGVLVAHPRLRVGMLEAHLSWIPGWLALLDHLGDRYSEARVHPELRPSDIFKQRCFVAAFPDDIAIRETIDQVGLANVVFSSDWPHKSLTEQSTSLDTLLARDELTADEKRVMTAVNPSRWMDLG